MTKKMDHSIPGSREARAITLLLTLVSAGASADSLSALKQMSLDELADLRVSIASNRPERLEDAAAAVYVITAEDIRRSGATTLPELLRTVPGMDVARISASEWAVSSRGFNNQFANKLLVMVDGRSIYTPLFSGVIWDEQNIVLQDVERIEVVRGPGGATWGANAVNGVINIITKPAEDTQGTLVSAVGGDRQSELVARSGFKLGESGHARLYTKVHQQDGLEKAFRSEAPDPDWSGGRAGFRGDWNWGDTGLMVQGEVYRERIASERQYSGGHLLGYWESAFQDGAKDVFQGYVHRFSLDKWQVFGNAAEGTVDTLDLGYRHQFASMGAHNLIAGLTYRAVRLDVNAVAPTAIAGSNRTDQLFSAFLQDDITLSPDQLYLTLGVKAEHNDFTGMEWQPSARLRWSPPGRGTLWAAISRAVRTPSSIEDSGTIVSGVAPSTATSGLPLVILSTGNADMDAETLTGYEIGYRIPATARLGLDATVFLNDYDQLRSVDMIGSPTLVPLPSPYLLWLSEVGNNLQGQTKGFELAADYRPRDEWRLRAAYSYLRIDLTPNPENTDLAPVQAEGESPNHQFSLVSNLDLRHDLELDVQARYVGELPAFAVKAYFTADARLDWRVGRHLDLALVGRNLLGPNHLEYGTSAIASSEAYLISREFYLTMNWRF